MADINELELLDELGQVEAIEVPKGVVDSDPYVPDENYDPANDEVDPETMGEPDMTGSFIADGTGGTTEVKDQ